MKSVQWQFTLFFAKSVLLQIFRSLFNFVFFLGHMRQKQWSQWGPALGRLRWEVGRLIWMGTLIAPTWWVNYVHLSIFVTVYCICIWIFCHLYCNSKFVLFYVFFYMCDTYMLLRMARTLIASSWCVIYLPLSLGVLHL